MNTASISESRSTSIDNLDSAPSAAAIPDSAAVQQHMPSDSELVNDILQEINQSNAGGGGTEQATVDANTVTQQQQTNDSAFARQVDTHVNHDLPPTNGNQLQDHASTAPAPLATSETHDTGLARTLAAAETGTGTDTDTGLLGSLGLGGGFDILLFAKTVLLFMIMYIVISNTAVQGLLCKLPYFGTAVAEGAAPQLSFMGTVVLALVGGVAMAGVQASV